MDYNLGQGDLKDTVNFIVKGLLTPISLITIIKFDINIGYSSPRLNIF